MKKRISILGSTGSIGENTLRVVKKDKKNFDIILLSTNKNINKIFKQAKEFKVKNIIIRDSNSFLKAKLKFKKSKIKIYNNFNSLNKIFRKKNDFIMSSITGLSGLEPTLKSIKFTKKILVATNHEQVQIIDKIKLQAEKNGVENIENLSNLRVSKIEPLIKCKEGLLVPTSGIIDSISFMNSLEWEIKEAEGKISYNSKISKINFDGQFFRLEILDKERNIIIIKCKTLINTAGLFASEVANKIQEIDKKFIPVTYFAKGNYFSVRKDLGIRHLIYPIPEGFGLGIHLTLELDNTIKFGPDVEWVKNTNNYDVNIERKDVFREEIKKYLPSLDVNLLQPSYSGIRPIMNKKNKSMRDFIIQSSNEHQIPGLLNLYGIESPGLTCSLALAEHINEVFIP